MTTLSLDRELTGVDDLLDTALSDRPAKPCEICPEGRPEACGLGPDHSHAADVEVLFSCGCVVDYCQTSYDGWLTAECLTGLDCAEHVTEDIIPVAVEPLR